MGTKLEKICEIPNIFLIKTCKLEVKYILLQHVFNTSYLIHNI